MESIIYIIGIDHIIGQEFVLGGNIKKVFYLTSAVLFFLITPSDSRAGVGSANASGSVSLELPCHASGGCPLDFLKCDTVLKSIEGTIDLLIQKKIEYLYSKGVDVNLFATTSTTLVGTGVETPICNLSEGEITQMRPPHAAIAKNGKTDCGQLKLFEKGGISLKNGLGTRETAYKGGAYAQAWKCYKQQVFNELEKNKSLTVKSLTQAAKELQSLHVQLEADIKKGAMEVVCSCGPTPYQCSDHVDTLDPVVNACHRVAFCKLQAAHLRLQSAFEYAVFSEIETRVLASWLVNDSGINNQLFNQVDAPCMSQAKSKCSKSFAGYVGSNISCVNNWVNNCYKTKYRSAMDALVRDLYPDNGACK